jgi:phosphate transport system substrate-binding protein
VVDPAKPESYPLVTYSWILLPRQEADAAKRAALKTFIAWGLGDGQRLAAALGYIPLPASVVGQAKGTLDTLP